MAQIRIRKKRREEKSQIGDRYEALIVVLIRN